MPRLKKPTTEWTERSKQCLAQGSTSPNSKRPNQYIEGVYPSHVVSGRSCYLTDAWGNDYVDFVCGLGSIGLGYSNNRVQEAVRKQVLKGANFSFPCTLEVELAEQLSVLVPGINRWRFLKTGSEACSAAVRIARAFTGRKKIVSKGYHGHSDIFTSLTEPGLGIKDQFEIIGWENYLWEDYATLSHKDIAAVIIEAIELDASNDWQKRVREIQAFCKEHGIVFILDEVITGFRVPKFSATAWWGLQPDIVVFGKAIANGYPLAAVGGRAEIMDSCEYFISSTFSGEAVSLAAAQATLTELETTKDLESLYYYGDRLRNKLNKLHPEIELSGYGTRGMLNTTSPTTALFMQEMCKAGYLFGKAWFFNFAHLEENIEVPLMNTVEDVMRRINRGEVKLEGKAAIETFKR